MNKKRIIAVAVLSLLAVGCNKSVGEDEATSKPSNRIISEALIASCPSRNLAMRQTDSSPLILEMGSSKGLTGIVSVYRQNGSLVQDSLLFVVSSLDTAVGDVYFGWNGKDSLGKALPNGNYFFFYAVLDSLNSVTMKDSSCISLVNSSAE